MKKLSFFIILIFIPLFFIGCLGDKDNTPEEINISAFETLNQQSSYTSTLTYKQDGKDVVETCVYEEIFDYAYYYYSYEFDNELKKQYWIDVKPLMTVVYKDVDGEFSSYINKPLNEVQIEASDKFSLLLPNKFNYSKNDLQLGTLEENGDAGDYKFTLGEYTFIIENKQIVEAQHKDYTIKYEQADASKIPYPNHYKVKTESATKATFDETILKIEKLENLAKQFITTNNLKVNSRYLALNYIRGGKSEYCTTSWNLLLGGINQNFVSYVENNEGADNISSLRDLEYIGEPYSVNRIDFMHLIAVISFGEKSGINSLGTDLGGIGGDLAQLTVDIKGTEGDEQDLYNAAKEMLGSDISGFNMEDFYSNTAGLNIAYDLRKDKDLKVSEAIKNYYYSNQGLTFTLKKLVSLLDLPLDNIKNTEDAFIARLERNTYITYWLSEHGAPITTYSAHFRACVKAYLNFVYECL